MTKNTTRLLSNLPIEELTSETDFLNILGKGIFTVWISKLLPNNQSNY